MKKIKGLDTLRAFAVFFVIIEHFGVWFDDTSWSGRVIRGILIPDGGFGLDLFFVLSGFLITSILFNAKDSAGNDHPLVIIKNFFVRRALRIFPIYYLLIGVLCLANYPGIKEHIGYYLTYTINLFCFRTHTWTSFSHTWTLDVEEQFYLLWPWFIIFINERYFKYVAAAAIAIGIVSSYYAMSVEGRIGPLLVFNSLDAFAIGGLYAWARRDAVRLGKFEKGLIPFVIASTVFYFGWKIALFNNSADQYWLFVLKTASIIISLWLIIRVVNNRSKWIGKYFLESRFLNFIGRISYGLYLYHYVYINGYCGAVNAFIYNRTLPYPQLNKIVHDHHVDYWIQVAIMILISALSFKLIEEPLLRLKTRFTYSREKS